MRSGPSSSLQQLLLLQWRWKIYNLWSPCETWCEQHSMAWVSLFFDFYQFCSPLLTGIFCACKCWLDWQSNLGRTCLSGGWCSFWVCMLSGESKMHLNFKLITNAARSTPISYPGVRCWRCIQVSRVASRSACSGRKKSNRNFLPSLANILRLSPSFVQRYIVKYKETVHLLCCLFSCLRHLIFSTGSEFLSCFVLYTQCFF